MKVAVIGIGAMGCLFAAKLAPLTEVTMLGSWPEQVATLRRDGLALYHLDGSCTRLPLKVATQPQEIGRADVALVLVKSGQTPRAAAQAKLLLDQYGMALTLQNGLGNLETLVSVLGVSRAALGVTAQGATVLGPGRVQHAGIGPTHLARNEALTKPLNDVSALFRSAGFQTHLVDDADGLVWGKLAINSGINPLTALLRKPNGYLAENPVARDAMERAARETAAVATALGITLPFDDAAARSVEVAKATASNRSSMLQDISRGAFTEIEAICGAVVAHGRRLGVPTPINEELLTLIRSVESGAREHISEHSPLAPLRALLPKTGKNLQA